MPLGEEPLLRAAEPERDRPSAAALVFDDLNHTQAACFQIGGFLVTLYVLLGRVVEQHDHIGVLLDLAGAAQGCHALAASAELAERDHAHAAFGKPLQCGRNLGDRLVLLADVFRVTRPDKLQIVHHDDVRLVSAGHGANLIDRNAGCLVKVEIPVGQFALGLDQCDCFGLLQIAGLDVCQVNTGLRRHDAVLDRLAVGLE